MQTTETREGQLYGPDCYPVAGHNNNDDGRRDRWAEMPRRERREEARKLIRELLVGEEKSEALFWVNRRKYSPRQLENFIASLERGLAARERSGDAEA